MAFWSTGLCAHVMEASSRPTWQRSHFAHLIRTVEPCEERVSCTLFALIALRTRAEATHLQA